MSLLTEVSILRGFFTPDEAAAWKLNSSTGGGWTRRLSGGLNALIMCTISPSTQRKNRFAPEESECLMLWETQHIMAPLFIVSYTLNAVYSSHARTTPVNPHHGIKMVKEEPNSQKLRSDQVFKEKQPVRLNTQLPASVV